MKSFLLFFLLLISASVSAQSNSKKSLRFDLVEIERKDIPYDSKELFDFKFTNAIGETITITNVQTSCGCTTAEKPENPIKKKKSGTISVSYDTKRVGEFVKTITVTSDKAPPVVLTIKGNVLPQKQ